MFKFKVLCPQYTDIAGNEYKQGDIVTTPLDLCSSFVNKFQLVEELEDIVVSEPAKGNETTKKNKQESKEEYIDATDEFIIAQEYAVKVLRKGQWYYVFDSDDLENALNEKGLRQEAVTEFIKTFGE